LINKKLFLLVVDYYYFLYLKKKNETRESGFCRKRVNWGHSKPIEVFFVSFAVVVDLLVVVAVAVALLLLLLLLLLLFRCCACRTPRSGLSVIHMPYPEWTYCDNMLGVKIARVEVPYAEWT